MYIYIIMNMFTRRRRPAVPERRQAPAVLPDRRRPFGVLWQNSY